MELAEQHILINRGLWFIRLRWLAIVFLIVSTFFAGNVLGIALPSEALYMVAAALAIYNGLFYLLLGYFYKRHSKGIFVPVTVLIDIQICMDMLALTMVMHLSGGIENPFIFYYIFHVIIASILLSVSESYLQATYACVLLGLLVLAEYTQVLRHYCLEGFLPVCLHQNGTYAAGTYFVFVTVVFLTAYMTRHIAIRLKNAERSHRLANQALMEKDRIKDEYVNRVTHDIKGHLTAMHSCLDIVNSGMTGQLSDRQGDFIGRAFDRTEKLMLFITQLLKLTQMRLSNNIHKQPFSVAETVKNAVLATRSKATEKSIQLVYNINVSSAQVYGDEFSFEEIITNIILNSIKYTPPHGKIEVNVSESDDGVLVQVKDTGIGIPSNEIDKVFDEFYRADNARAVERDGTGLGLAIARQIVKRQGGKIWAESPNDTGTEVFIWLAKGRDSKFSHLEQ